MSIEVATVKCPACGANVSVENNREFTFCTYCGSRIVIKNDNEHIYRNIDEAKLKEVEYSRELKLIEMQMAEKANFPKKTLIIIWISAVAILLIAGIIGFSIENSRLGMCTMLGLIVGILGGMGLFSSNDNKKKNKHSVGPDEVMITESMISYYDQNFNHVELLFRGAGFASVTAIPLNDLNMFNQRKNGRVENVTINGSEDFDEGDVVSKNSHVLITYHSR